MKATISDPQAVQIVIDHVIAERTEGRKVSCESLLVHFVSLGHKYTINSVRDFVKSGSVPGLKLVQKEGIVPDDYRLGSEVRAEKTLKNKAERAEKKALKATDKEAAKAQRLQKKAAKEAEKLLKQSKAEDVATSTVTSEDASVAA